MKDLPRRFVYRFWASRRPRFPPFRQESPELPIPPAEPAQSGFVFRRTRKTQRTTHHIRHAVREPAQSPKIIPAESRKVSPRGACGPHTKACLPNRPESFGDPPQNTDLDALYPTMPSIPRGTTISGSGQKCADAFCKTGPPLAPGPG